jgi:hypothetical protein
MKYGWTYRPRWYHRDPPNAISLCDENHRSRYESSHLNFGSQAKLNHSMNEFGILNSRKRALIALIHSIVFLGIAMHGFASPKPGVLVRPLGATPDMLLIAIYVTVACILAWLVRVSRCAQERVYFALCAGSASFALLRTLFGDTALPAAQYLRVIMLTSAVGFGVWIFCSFSRPAISQ